jgi:hypothetical protein
VADQLLRDAAEEQTGQSPMATAADDDQKKTCCLPGATHLFDTGDP